MVEPILYASFGALLATLIGLLFLPFFWRRAVTLTTRGLANRLPVSASEIVASHDRLRAEQAMAMRAVERKAERAVSEATRDRVESARARSTELGHLADLAELRAQVLSLQSEGARARVERDRHGAEAASAYDALAEARAASEAAAQDLQAARQDASASRTAAELAQNEASGRASEIEQLRARLAAYELVTETPIVADGRPRLPRVGLPSSTSHKSEADLPSLRARLDEVADAILRASDAPAEPKRSRSGTPRALKGLPKRMRVISARSVQENAEV